MAEEIRQITTPSQNRNNIAFGLMLVATLVGGLIRLQPMLASPAPLNDGGLFYRMIADLIQNNFILPATTTYNGGDIPFAYPPFAFYFAGIMHTFSGWGLLDVVRVMPALVSILTIPVFYLLAGELLESRIAAAFATLSFALLPRAFEWGIMGGGITRSLGFLFAILTLWQMKRYISSRQIKNLGGIVLFSALVVYTHPEAIIHTLIGTVGLYLFFDRSRKGFISLCGCVAVILMLTLPWWGLTLSRHGVGPFLAASVAARENSYNPLIGLLVFFRFYFTDEPFVDIIAVLGLLGCFGLLARRQPFLPVWLFIVHLLEPRGGPLYMMLPLALSSGYALHNMLLPALGMTWTDGKPMSPIAKHKSAYGFLIFFLLYSTFSAYYVTSKISGVSLTRTDMETMQWVGEHIPSKSRFAILTGHEPLQDAISEWFPALTDNMSVATVFGYEWVNDGHFYQRTENYKTLQACLSQDVTCLDTWSGTTGLLFDYVYIRTDKQHPSALMMWLKQSGNYQQLYGTADNAIFKKINLP